MTQIKSAEQKVADDLYEMSKPLARYRDDEDLEILLKEREREGDPMLAFIKKKKDTEIDQTGRPKKGMLHFYTFTNTCIYNHLDLRKMFITLLTISFFPRTIFCNYPSCSFVFVKISSLLSYSIIMY